MPTCTSPNPTPIAFGPNEHPPEWIFFSEARSRMADRGVVLSRKQFLAFLRSEGLPQMRLGKAWPRAEWNSILQALTRFESSSASSPTPASSAARATN